MNLLAKLSEGLLYFLLGASVFIFGAAFVGGYTLFQGGVVALTALLILRYGISCLWSAHVWRNTPIFLLFIWTVFVLLQLWPLPTWLVEKFSPQRIADLERFSISGLTQAQAIPLSLATDNMKIEVGKLVTYVALFFMVSGAVTTKAHVKRFCYAAVFIGLALSLIGLFFHRFRPGMVYGILEFARANPFTPYVNKNHFANYLVMTLPLVLGFMFLLCDRSSLPNLGSWRQKVLWFGSREAMGVWMMAAFFVIQLVALLAVASRGALFGFVVAVSSFAWLFILRSRKWIVMGVTLGIIFILLAYGVYEVKPLIYKLKLMQEAAGTDYALQFRLSNWQDTLRMFIAFPLFGIGAGGFHALFPLYKTTPELGIFSQTRFYYAENELLQGLAELGVIGMVLLIAFMAVLGIDVIKKWFDTESKTTKWLALGMISACFGMLTHSLVDFPTHIPANMAMFAVLGGVLARVSRTEGLRLARVENMQNMGRISVATALIRAAIVGGILFVAFPFLWRQWASEHYYLKAKEDLTSAAEKGVIASPPVLSAYEHLLRAKKWGEDQARIHYELGQVLTYLGMLAQEQKRKQEHWFQQAERSLTLALTQFPLASRYHYALGWLYEQWGQLDRAQLHLKNASGLEPQNPFYRFQQGRNQLRLDDTAAARLLFKETLQINTNYLGPVLEALVASGVDFEAKSLQEILPDNDSRELVLSGMISFFELRQNEQIVNSLKRFPEKLATYG